MKFTISREDDGFVDYGVLTPYNLITRQNDYELGVNPFYLYDLPLPQGWAIQGSSKGVAHLYNKGILSGRIDLAGGNHSRYIKGITYLDRFGAPFLIEGYSKFGYRYFSKRLGFDGRILQTLWYNNDGQVVVLEDDYHIEVYLEKVYTFSSRGEFLDFASGRLPSWYRPKENSISEVKKEDFNLLLIGSTVGDFEERIQSIKDDTNRLYYVACLYNSPEELSELVFLDNVVILEFIGYEQLQNLKYRAKDIWSSDKGAELSLEEQLWRPN